MSLPASNRKTPSRAALVATLSALTALGASAAVAQTGQPYAYGQQLPAAPFGYAQQGFAPQGYAQQAPFGAPQGFPGYAIQPASTYAPQPAPQGYAAPVQQPAPQQVPGYAAPQQPQPFPGYGIPGGFPAPGPAAGFDPYGGFGPSAQWGQFAPSEPTYAPAEPVSAAPAPVAAAQPAVPVQSATVSTTVASDYTYEVAPEPASSPTYVGTTQQLATGGNDPYQAIVNQQPAPAQQYEPAPNYTQYEATASYPEPVQAQQESVNIGGYEYQPAQQQAATGYYDLGAETAAAAAAALSVVAPQQVVVAPPVYAAPGQLQGAHFVQVGAFVDPGRANNLVNQLGAAGEQAIVIPAQVRGKLYHRVRVLGGSQRDARVVRDRIRNLGYYEARVVKG